MSGKLVGRCLRDVRIDHPSGLAVLVCIAEHARDSGLGAVLNVETVARESRLKPRMTRMWLRRLEAIGDLSTVAQRGRTSAYFVHPGAGEPRQSIAAPTPATDAQDPGNGA